MFLFNKNRKVYVASYSSQGGREINEDSLVTFEKANKDCLAAVADGLGGQGGGQIASSEAIKVVAQGFKQTTDYIPERIMDWFDDANKEVIKHQSDECKMMTTMVALTIFSNTARWAHVGDSRLYHFVDGKLEFQSFDHSVSQMAVLSGEITKDQIRGHADRNRLLRALGRDDDVMVEISDPVDVSKNKHSFLLCTDGFWEMVYENEMEELLVESKNPDEWLKRMRKKHRQRVTDGHDNNSAIAIWIR